MITKQQSRYDYTPTIEDVEVTGIVYKIVQKFDLQKKQFKTIDLFAGIGGIRVGFENAGFKTVFSNDFDKKCEKTL
ncbi:MAG: hypothetical protein ACD_12C00051G0001 [uncultured bacterium]|uniref:Modification methylase DsaV n=1 Tax=Berkelbacteria bacterium GW2011_GWA2_35_9 TaxID=1618333 RepID=A0A0G0FN81_9BACT|nr:MAG: hypothetical protein ACD_12C00051G0001 [uncultured bacterium]KKP88900.1 MAG: Modification methylase DsaV [Berkelbacteria bacterium GW2011_GWA2_35_9]